MTLPLASLFGIPTYDPGLKETEPRMLRGSILSNINLSE